jgi:hypothetical protein
MRCASQGIVLTATTTQADSITSVKQSLIYTVVGGEVWWEDIGWCYEALLFRVCIIAANEQRTLVCGAGRWCGGRHVSVHRCRCRHCRHRCHTSTSVDSFSWQRTRSRTWACATRRKLNLCLVKVRYLVTKTRGDMAACAAPTGRQTPCSYKSGCFAVNACCQAQVAWNLVECDCCHNSPTT